MDHRKQDVLRDMTNVPHFILPLLSRQLGDGEGLLCVDASNGSHVVTIGTQTLEYQQEDCNEDGSEQPTNQNLSTLYHGAWPTFDKGSGIGNMGPGVAAFPDTASVMSFNSAHTSSTQAHAARTSNHQLGTKVEMVYSLLSMLGTHDKDDMSRTLLAMSSSQDSCIAMRQSGCLPLLVQLLHGSDKDSVLGNTRGRKTARARAAAALHNIVHSHPDDKRGRREARVLRLLEQIRAHCDQLRDSPDEDEDAENQDSNKKSSGHGSADIDHHPGPAIAALMKLSFDEEHRHAICTLGGLQAIAELLQLDHDANENTSEQYNITMRRYACMALTNLTFGDGTNKALLCSMKTCMKALVAQLQSSNEDLRQVAASVLRNLSWRADLASKKTLREVGAVVALMKASMEVSKESTLKSILSALWNLSAHCSENKADICAVDESLAFLVTTLTYKSPSKTLAIIENGGGILRNISSHIAIREEYRKVLREHGCLQILLKHLRSPSLTIVSNACGTLWNLSARCPEDQKALWDLGAVSMLRNLVHSKHKMISMGSAAALKNLLAAKPSMMSLDGDRHKQSNMPTLHVRKQRALEAELDQTLAETCDNVESPSGSPTEQRKHIHVDASKNFVFGNDHNAYQSGDPDHRRSFVRNQFARNPSADSAFMLEAKMRSPSRPVSRSGSQDSVGSVHSDISHDRVRTHNVLAKSNRLLAERQNINSDRRMSDRRAGPNSRIVQVMQEVAMHAGLDGNYRETHSAENTPPTMRRSQTNPTLRDAANIPPRVTGYMKSGQQFSPRHSIAGDTHLTQRLGQQQSQPPQQTPQPPSDSHMPYQNITKCMENLHLDDDSSQEQPINYSLKYADGPSQGKPPNQNQGFIPAGKVGNFMQGLMFNGQSQAPQQNTQSMQSPPHKANPQYNEYSEQDSDAMDQPTNYSIRFAEQVDDGHFSDQPINYSTRFQEAGADEVQETDDTIIQQEQDEMNQDTIRTFCTEGTPYLSTATSMEDLTGIGKEDKPKTPQQKAASDKPYPGHFTESHSSKSTEHQTTSTVVRGKQTESAANIQNNNISRVVDTVPQPSLYSYNDNTTASPGSDKPMQYCTEGTPMCFSRVSSLSSLHSTDAHDHPDNNQNRGDLTLQSIDENQSLETTNQRPGDTPLRSDVHNRSHNTTSGSTGSGTNTPGHHKSVTFDENNQVQETPLMFSRCSSLGSLSSFDAHSVHSSVVSDYSRRASEVVSPSELPDSPSDSMPGSPGHKSPVKFDSRLNDSQTTNVTQIRKPVQQPQPHSNISGGQGDNNVQIVRPIPTKTLFADSPKQYGDEGTPDFSCATSLSGLDMDEPEISRDAELQRVPLGPEEGEEEVPSSGEPSQLEFTIMEKTAGATELDNESGSDGDEDMLNEYISLAMPKNSQRKAKKNAFEKQQMQGQASSDVPRSPFIKVSTGFHMALEEPDALDSIRQYGTEDTPLNYSRDDALSNLSFNSSTGELINIGELGDAESPTHDDDDKSDLSSIADDEDCEDLLSEAIAAAMPKKAAKSSKPTDSRNTKIQMDRVSEGASSKEKLLQQSARPAYSQKNAFSMAARSVTQSVPHQGDTTKTYCEEGTPINFSRATSLSDLSHLDPDGASQDHSIDSEIDESDALDELPTYYDRNTSLPVEVMDSPKPFGMEGTPLSFSRNDSLSSLSCDEDAELESAKQGLRKLPPHSKGSPKALLTPKQRLLGRLSSPGNKNRSPGSRAQRTLSFGKPQPQSPLAMSPPRAECDQLQSFAVEGTPHCFSRNSSLSSLNSSEHDPEAAGANISDITGDDEDIHQACSSDTSADHHQLAAEIPPDSFFVEDTPANFSRNSSLSSLSVESLGFEASETALLEECINAAMPKMKSAKKKISKIPRNCPTSSSTPKDKFVKPRTLPGNEPPKVKTPSPSREGSPKNVQSSQHGNVAERTNVDNPTEHPQLTIENVVWRHRSPSQELEGSPKLLKDASNQEKVLGALMMESEDKNCEGKDDSQVKDLVFDFDNKLYISESELENKNNEEEYDNNRLANMELADSDMIASAIFREASEIAEEFAEAAQMESMSCSESDYPIVGKEDIEATKESQVVQENDDQLGCAPLEFSFHDITKETFPDMGFSLGSSMMSSLGDENAQVTVRRKSSAGANIANISEQSLDEGVGQDDSHETTVEDADSQRCAEESDVNPHEITLEEEKALEENAELLIRELSNVHLSQLSSSANSEMFIENETISLVSNDTDTASEVSVSLSCSSKATSEKTNEDSNTSTSTATRPRILKPGERSSLEMKAKEEDAKAVRGKRRSLLSRTSAAKPTSAASPKNDPKSKKVTPPAKPSTVKSKPPVGNSKVTPKTPGKVTPASKPSVTPAKTGVKQSKPTGPAGGKPTAGVKPTPKASAVVAPMSSGKNVPQSVAKAAARKPSPGRSGTASPRNQSPADKMRNKTTKETSSLASINMRKPQSKVTSALTKGKTKDSGKVNNNDSERPKPPIKQGTFTKDSPTQNAPDIEGDDNSDTKEAPGSNRSSAELKYSNDTQEKAPGDKTSPRSSKTDTAGPSSTPPAVANLKQKSVTGKSNSTGNLTKTKSVTKTASGSNLTKTGSNTSLTKQTGGFKVPGKPPLKRGESTSNQSLKKDTAAASKTPANSAKKGSDKTGGRATVPVASKIASLWRKGDSKSPSKPNAEKKTPLKKEKDITPAKSTDTKPKFLRRSLASSQPSKGSKEDGRPSKHTGKKDDKEGMQRSSTYDKLPVNEGEAEAADKTETTSGSPAKNNVWRRTYTIETEDEVLQAVTSEDGDTSLGVWMRRDGDRTPGKSQIPGPARTSPEQGEKRGNKPSPPSAFPNKSGLGISPPGAKGPTVTSPNAAIVAPFNYVPTQTQNKPVPSTNDQNDDLKGGKPISTESPPRPMTKTEMLIARRRQSYLNSVNKTSEDPKSNEEDDSKRTACLVTTV